MVWDSNAENQRQIIAGIEGKLNQLRQRTSALTLYSTTTPTAAQLAAVFSAAYPPAYSPALYEEVQWVDPSTNILQNVYARAEDIGTGAPNTASTGVQQPYLTFPSAPIPYTVLGEIYVDDAGMASPLSINVSDTSFNNLCLYFQIRDSANAANATVSLRVNGLSAANYGASWQGANSTFGLGTEQNSAAAWTFTAPAASLTLSQRTHYLQGMARFFDYNNTLRMPRVHVSAVSVWGAPYTTSTTTNYNFFGPYNALVSPITSVSFVSATGFAAGSRLVLFGV
jgi:hypothetical protein